MMNESSIYFFPGGGHEHDGENSSLIDTNAYSLFDFNFGFQGGPNRVYRQELNFSGFKQLIINTVNDSLLEPAGLVLQPGIVNGNSHIIAGSITSAEIAANTITANNIAAGTITANELSSNIILVNNFIRSNNFDGTIASNGIITSDGTAGWAITWAGDAVFDSAAIRGSIVAASVSTPGVDIFSNGTLSANSFTLYGNGAIVTSSGNFSVDANGVLFATGANISGTITATAVSTPGVDILSNGTLSASTFTLYGNGAIVTSSGNFSVDASGNLFAQNADIIGDITSSNLQATGGSIGGWLIDGSNLRSTNALTILSPGGNITIAGTLAASGQVNSGGDMNASGTIETAAGFVMGNSGTVLPANSVAVRRRTSDGLLLLDSSRRELKENIEDIQNPLDIIKLLRPRSFVWKDKSSYEHPNSLVTEKLLSNKEFGFVAEEVEAAVSSLAIYDSGPNGQSIIPIMWQQNGTIALCVAAIKELCSRIEAIEQQLGYNS